MKKHAIRAGLLLTAIYIFCLLWRVTMIDAEVMNFHLLSLKTLFPGFQGYDPLSIVWGAILTFGYGFLASFAFHSFHANCCISKESKKEEQSCAHSKYLLCAGTFVFGLLLGMLLTGFNSNPGNGYGRDFGMTRSRGYSMMQMRQMMKNAGGMMSERGQRYGDNEMMQRGREMMQQGKDFEEGGPNISE